MNSGNSIPSVANNNNPNVTSAPERSKIPKQVRLKINNIDTVVSWQTFIDLLICTHEFETNFFPVRAHSGSVEVILLDA